jgi:hypothetical protein
VNQFQSAGTSVWFVETVGGTGVGQRRYIASNTATVLTIAYRWDVQPDATTQYKIIADVGNNHGLLPNAALTSGSLTLDGVIWQFGGCDVQGDCWLHLDQGGVTYTQIRNIILQNAMGDTSGTPFTMFDHDTGNLLFLHNTYMTGSESCSLREPATSGTGAGQCSQFKSNLAYCDPNRTMTPPNNTDHTKYWTNGGSYGPYAAVDTSNPTNPASGTLDLIVAGGVTNNGVYGPNAGLAGKGFHLNMSVAPDNTNIIGTDPNFVDNTRTFWGWAVTQGSVSTTIGGKIADGINYIRNDPTLPRTSLIPYIKAGLTPQASAYIGTGHDGANIGAV